jgi:hypothetical protein
LGSRRTRPGGFGIAAQRHWVVAALCLVTAAARAAAATPLPDLPSRLVFDSGLLTRLQTLAAGLHSEIVLCLTGSVKGPAVVATGFVMPEPHLSDSDRASFGPCPGEPVAIWHNHPLEGRPRTAGASEPSYARPRGDPNASPRDLCALSETDIRTAARDGYPFVVIAVDRETWCWWTREQVLALARRRAVRGDPVPGQLESGSPRQGSRSRPYQTP